jgi:hypothetical protein
MTQRHTADGDAWKERLDDADLSLSRLGSLGRPHHATSRDADFVPVDFVPVLLNSTDRYNTGKKTPVKRHRYSTPFSRPFAQKWAMRRSFDEDGYLSSVSTVQRYLGEPVQTPGEPRDTHAGVASVVLTFTRDTQGAH